MVRNSGWIRIVVSYHWRLQLNAHLSDTSLRTLSYSLFSEIYTSTNFINITSKDQILLKIYSSFSPVENFLEEFHEACSPEFHVNFLCDFPLKYSHEFPREFYVNIYVNFHVRLHLSSTCISVKIISNYHPNFMGIFTRTSSWTCPRGLLEITTQISRKFSR